MKKLYLSCLALAALGFAANVQGQGTIFLNNFDSGMGIFLNNGTSTVSAPGGTEIEVLGGATAGSMVPIFIANGGASLFVSDPTYINANGPGTGAFFDVTYGHVPSVAAGATGFFQVIAWIKGNGQDTFAGAQYAGSSAIFSEATGTDPAAPTTPIPTSLNIPGPITLTPVITPEPTSLALGGIGAAALLLFRRKK